MGLFAVSKNEAGRSCQCKRHCPAPGQMLLLEDCRTGPAVTKELLNLYIVARCTFDSTKTGAEAVSRICRTHVNGF